MHRATLATAATVLAVSALAGCGDDNTSDVTGGTDDYCAAIEQAQADFENLGNFDFAQFDDMRTAIGDIADQAPDSVADEWQLVDDRFGQVVDAFNELGIDPADLSNPQALQEIDQSKLQELQRVGQQLDSPEVQEATQAINRQVREDCGINLGN